MRRVQRYPKLAPETSVILWFYSICLPVESPIYPHFKSASADFNFALDTPLPHSFLTGYQGVKNLG